MAGRPPEGEGPRSGGKDLVARATAEQQGQEESQLLVGTGGNYQRRSEKQAAIKTETPVQEQEQSPAGQISGQPPLDTMGQLSPNRSYAIDMRLTITKPKLCHGRDGLTNTQLQRCHIHDGLTNTKSQRCHRHDG